MVPSLEVEKIAMWYSSGLAYRILTTTKTDAEDFPHVDKLVPRSLNGCVELCFNITSSASATHSATGITSAQWTDRTLDFRKVAEKLFTMQTMLRQQLSVVLPMQEFTADGLS